MTSFRETIAITGSTGFLGSRVARALTDNGFKVVHVARSIEKVESQFPGQDWITSEISCDDLALKFENLGVSQVVHFATHFTKEDSASAMAQCLRSNLEFGSMVFAATMRQQARFINANSLWQLEAGSLGALPYSLTKKWFSEYIHSKSSWSSKVVDIFLPDTFGAGDSRGKLIESLIRSAVRRESFRIQNQGLRLNLSSGARLAQYLLEEVVAHDSPETPILYLNYPNVEVSEISKYVAAKCDEQHAEVPSMRGWHFEMSSELTSILKLSGIRAVGAMEQADLRSDLDHLIQFEADNWL